MQQGLVKACCESGQSPVETVLPWSVPTTDRCLNWNSRLTRSEQYSIVSGSRPAL